jgi:hypothetical protein
MSLSRLDWKSRSFQVCSRDGGLRLFLAEDCLEQCGVRFSGTGRWKCTFATAGSGAYPPLVPQSSESAIAWIDLAFSSGYRESAHALVVMARILLHHSEGKGVD